MMDFATPQKWHKPYLNMNEQEKTMHTNRLLEATGIKAALHLMLVVAMLLGLSACGSSSLGTDTSSSGELELAITDAEEDFLSYEIALTGVTLERRNGTRVEVLPVTTQIDFVQYQELSELFAVLSVPAGIYERILLQLDYSNADIVIQNESGESFAATAIDVEGNAVTTLEVELQLGDGEFIHITPGKTAALTLDLDLAASNTIESYEPAIVRVEPFMLGTAFLDTDREHRVRGLLRAVSESDSEFTLAIRPMRLRQGEFGTFTIDTDSQTRFDIDGVEYEGEAGLRVLASLETGTPVVTYGSPSEEAESRYLATQVHAGSSVAWSEEDVLKGTITAREGNNITLRGGVLELADGSAHFRQTVTLTVDDTTSVTGYRLGDADISQLSIGQQIIALGDYDMDNAHFDASGEHVRMKVNRIVGQVAQALPLQLDLSHINRRPIDIFDFTGTGIDTLSDADPDQYEINTGTLDTSNIEQGEFVQVRGYPTAFGTAPMDFDALSIIDPDFSSHAAKLHSFWSGDSEGNVLVSQGSLQLSAETARMKLHLRGIPGSLALDLQVNTISNDGEQGRFAILARGNGIHIYRDFASFTAALDTLLQAGREVLHLTAAGSYDEGNTSLSAKVVTVRMGEAE